MRLLMPMASGARIGPYEIVGLLGAGGMGEVYRGRDTRLNRDVALKILPDAFAGDPERLARFEREAQVLASLSHANIGAIFGLEEGTAGGGPPVRALVLELVEGPTLADRIARGPIPLDEALPIARQIADALEAAHQKGIIHRDLKPANVKIAPNGAVKVLDFGLAKLAHPSSVAQGSSPALTNSPTMLTAASMPGMILGTAAYMSPEQAKGHDADRTSDVWAFGCVLYEMLTGRRAFVGDTVSEIISEVLKSEPDWTRLPQDTPDAVRRLMRRCLQKDPRQRLRHIGDVRLEFDDAAEPSRGEAGASGGAARSRRRLMVLAAVGGTALALGIAGGVLLRPGSAKPPAPVKRFQIAAPELKAAGFRLSFSPSGSTLAISGTERRGSAIWIRRLESLEPRRLVDTRGASNPFWSPDEQFLGFFDGGQLKTVAIATGQTRIVADAPNGMGGTWSKDGTILFAGDATGGLQRVSAQGGAVTKVTKVEAGQDGHRWPQFLPDGRHFLFMGWNSRRARYTIHLGAIGQTTSTTIATEVMSAPVFDPAGFVLFVNGAPPRLVALPFDGATLKVTGEPTTVAEDVEHDWVGGTPLFTSAPDGTLVYENTSRRYSSLTWFDRLGRETGSIGETAVYYDPDLSPDGKFLAIEKADPNVYAGDVWSLDLERGTSSRLTREPAFDNMPVWSPDGKRLVFSSDRGGSSELYITDVNNSGTAVLLLAGPGTFSYATDWSPDGRHLLFTRVDQKVGASLWALPMAGTPTPIPVVQGSFEAGWARFSPDGRWIAYLSAKSGDNQIYVRSWPDGTVERQVSTRGGAGPQWRRDGKELFYSAPDGSVMAASIATSPGNISPATPTALFNAGLNRYSGLRNRFAAAADGQRFLVLKPLEGKDGSALTVILNWTKTRN